MKRVLATVVKVLSSLTLSFWTFVLLLVLVFVGTWQQQYESLYDVQQRYFASWFYSLRLYGVPLLLPGGALLMTVLFVNLLVGGVVRMRKHVTTAGVIVIHLGILLLLVGSLVEFLLSEKGYMVLREGQTGRVFESYQEWELAVAGGDPAQGRELVVPDTQLAGAQAGRTRRFVSPALPFELVVEGFARNSAPKPAQGPGEGEDGFVLKRLDDSLKAEANVPGCFVTVVPKQSGGPKVRALLWGEQRHPWAVQVDGRTWQIDLRRRTYVSPFAVRLDKFVRRLHPGTQMAAEFSSYVTKIDRGTTSEAHITMNAPLRDQGVIMYQEGWGPQDPNDRGPPWSQFAVVRNPSDQVPLISCIVIAAGMLLHFILRLVKHLKAESVRTAPPSKEAVS